MNATTADLARSRTDGRYFYVWMAGAFILVAFGGFTPTFWAPVAAGTFHAPPIIYLHGALMFTWTCFYFVQTALVAGGRTMSHRNWGLAGIALFSVVACSILVGQLVIIKSNEVLGLGDAARRFSAVTLCLWPVLVGLFTVAIMNNRRSEVHKRLMTLVMIAMLTPAIARVFLTYLAPPGAAGGGPPPPFVSIPPALTADLFLVFAIVRDWRRLGHPHPAYIYGGVVLIAEQLLAPAIATTAVWMSIAKAFEGLAG